MYSYKELKEQSVYDKIGRYNINGNTTDIVFNREFSDKWTLQEKNEYLYGNNGYYRSWTYDIKSMYMRNLIMSWINESQKRDPISIIRYLMSKISYDNSGDESLLYGSWDVSSFIDGKNPSHWMNSNDIFYERFRTGKSVRYGQCWCFAECMTSICRFLGLPCRTICGKNTLIDANLDNGIDFNEDLRKGDSHGFILKDKESLNKELFNISNNIYDNNKSGDVDILKIYDSGDSYWNVHYWNEVWINGEWWVFDSTPFLRTTSNDEYNGMKMLGPMKVSGYKDPLLNNDFNTMNLFSMINSPFRLWTTETIVDNDELITLPYVYSIIYPDNERMSIFIRNKRINSLFNMSPIITTRLFGNNSTVKLDISKNYKSPSTILHKTYFNSAYLEGEFYIQIVYLDNFGNVIKIERYNKTVTDMVEFYVNPKTIPECYLVSYLIVEKLEDNSRSPKWFTFLKYNN